MISQNVARWRTLANFGGCWRYVGVTLALRWRTLLNFVELWQQPTSSLTQIQPISAEDSPVARCVLAVVVELWRTLAVVGVTLELLWSYFGELC
jgi:hypothetical protein